VIPNSANPICGLQPLLSRVQLRAAPPRIDQRQASRVAQHSISSQRVSASCIPFVASLFLVKRSTLGVLEYTNHSRWALCLRHLRWVTCRLRPLGPPLLPHRLSSSHSSPTSHSATPQCLRDQRHPPHQDGLPGRCCESSRASRSFQPNPAALI
jgi:hypothetical protein